MSKYDVIIRNGNIVFEHSIKKGDIGILNGKIVEVSSKIDELATASEVINAEKLYVLPGLIDIHVHFNEPGRTEWEGLYTGSRSLAAGGVTTFFDMPLNSDPPLIYPSLFKVKKNLALEKSMIDFGILGGVVPENLNYLEELKKCGVIGFKGFMSNSGIKEFNYLDDDSLFEGLKIISRLDSVAMIHAESEVITKHLSTDAILDKRLTAKDYVESRPIVSEIEAVDRAICMAEATNCKIHIVHASNSEVVERVKIGKRRGVDVTVETCPHYLSLTVENLKKQGAIAKCSPPLRKKEDVDKLWKSLVDGDIDIISSDHSPCLPELKDRSEKKNIFDVWGGISSAQSTLNVLLEEGYWKRGVKLELISKLTSANPAKRFGIYPSKGKISLGSDADLAIIDINKSFILKKEDLLYKHQVSPFVGRKFRGKVIYTIAGGHKIFENGNIVDEGYRGKLVRKKV
ncbi:allantoinase AllB [Clostridium psychrophilum]|uniref:allantoinase AllB n=1 Tax=Clostridium psychrophilum TaxID=132926 RepID=UPI001C0BE96F|nr:allantoinase AllB [Clostridium psychrophilum]MBU3180834.1 allantoinase AllB [Clostridium psychrophilum]